MTHLCRRIYTCNKTCLAHFVLLTRKKYPQLTNKLLKSKSKETQDFSKVNWQVNTTTNTRRKSCKKYLSCNQTNSNFAIPCRSHRNVSKKKKNLVLQNVFFQKVFIPLLLRLTIPLFIVIISWVRCNERWPGLNVQILLLTVMGNGSISSVNLLVLHC